MRFALSAVVAVAMTLEVLAIPVQQPPQQRPPVFTATANFVQSDVIVRDSRGRLVSGLTGADFVIYEDDVRQKIDQAGSDADLPDGVHVPKK